MANPVKKNPTRRNRLQPKSTRWLVAGVLLSSAVLATGLGLSRARRVPVTNGPSAEEQLPEPPSLGATDIDPAVRKAVEAARLKVSRSPHSAEAWGRLGMLLKAHRFSSEAHTCFVQAERLDPRDPRWPYHQGIELADRDPEEAVAKLRQTALLLSDGPEAPRLRLGELLLRLGRLEEAAGQFHRVLQQDPNHARAHLDLARLAFEQGELPVVLDHLRYSVADRRTRKGSQVLAAEVHQRLGDMAAADEARRRAAQLPEDSPWPDPWTEEVVRLRTGKQVGLARADLLLSQGRQSDAIVLLQEILREYPDSDWGWLLLGRAFLGQRALPAAEEALRKAAQQAPGSMEVQYYLGVVLLLREDPGGAALCFRRATEIKPDFAEAYHNLGHCLLRQGDRTGAVEAFRKAVLCKPNYGDAHRDLGEALAKGGQIPEALVQLTYALQLDPADATSRQRLEQVLPRIPFPIGP